MKNLKFVGWLLIVCVVKSISGGTDAEGYFKQYMEGFTEGVKCHKGFTKVSARIKNAAEKCSKEPVMASAMCFKTCVYREYEFIKRGTDEIDIGMADLVTMESFNMEAQDGRDSYLKISLSRFYCLKNYTDSGNKLTFAKKYDDAADCAKGQPFFTCNWKSLMCGSEKYSSPGSTK